MRWLLSLFVISLIQLIRADGCEDAKPVFSAPGRRISEQKCQEYNWERKQIEKCSTDAANTEYPYIGSVGFRKNDKMLFLCGAFLVSPKFAVTAGHCLNPPTLTPPEFIRFGNKNLEDSEPHVDAKIIKAITHPGYKPPSKENDIALVELESELPFTRSIQPACLWSQAAHDQLDLFSPGWTRSKKEMNKVISELKVAFIDKELCSERLKKHNVQIYESQICANESIVSRNCLDVPTTSPIITRVKLDGKDEDLMPYAVAMGSYGEKCGQVGVYSRIYSFLDWIEQNVWK
ncbi:hypothetical protein ABMA27_005690 [Loxostege sticticalis]|uniref:Peptidase S1 domain-containing protein n=1 Tax=Loxostege sticticalis TaxID=481309 RepID=A0ABR3HK30_LOXSC